jgi:uncharacterized protein (DUF1499 family)
MKTTQDWQFDRGESTPNRSRSMTTITILFYLSCANLVLIAAAPLVRLYLNTPGYLSFRIMLIAIVMGIFLGILALIIAIISIFTKSHIVWSSVITVFTIGMLPPLVTVIMMGKDAINKPLIHDITTDINTPPEYQEVKNLRKPGDNPPDYTHDKTATSQVAAYPDIKPLITSLNVEDALMEATQVVKDLQWELVNLDYEKGTIEAYDTSKLFGFVDDIIIRVQSDDGGSRIDIRSSSRVGKGDLGKNAERIRMFIKSFRP